GREPYHHLLRPGHRSPPDRGARRRIPERGFSRNELLAYRSSRSPPVGHRGPATGPGALSPAGPLAAVTGAGRATLGRPSSSRLCSITLAVSAHARADSRRSA